MTTDWQLVRRLLNSALDACEALDRLEITDDERGVVMPTADGACAASVWDALQSAHIAPENMRYSVIRGRGQLGDAALFVQPVSRVLLQVGALAAELIGAQQLRAPVKGLDPYSPESVQSMASAVEDLAAWYERYLVPNVEEAVTRARSDAQS